MDFASLGEIVKKIARLNDARIRKLRSSDCLATLEETAEYEGRLKEKDCLEKLQLAISLQEFSQSIDEEVGPVEITDAKSEAHRAVIKATELMERNNAAFVDELKIGGITYNMILDNIRNALKGHSHNPNPFRRTSKPPLSYGPLSPPFMKNYFGHYETTAMDYMYAGRRPFPKPPSENKITDDDREFLKSCVIKTKEGESW